MIFSSCKKDSSQSNSLSFPIDSSTNTSLQIKISDTLGNSVPGATVYLYPTINYSFLSSELHDTGTADKNGIVTFTGLFPQRYFYSAFDSCENNIFGKDSTMMLTANIVNQDSTILESTGTLVIANDGQQGGLYKVFVDDSLIVDTLNDITPLYMYIKTGIHSVRVANLPNYPGAQADTTYYTTYISCGDTYALNFN
jgi:hypothetical protein